MPQEKTVSLRPSKTARTSVRGPRTSGYSHSLLVRGPLVRAVLNWLKVSSRGISIINKSWVHLSKLALYRHNNVIRSLYNNSDASLSLFNSLGGVFRSVHWLFISSNYLSLSSEK